jgi:hypothetical protein
LTETENSRLSEVWKDALIVIGDMLEHLLTQYAAGRISSVVSLLTHSGTLTGMVLFQFNLTVDEATPELGSWKAIDAMPTPAIGCGYLVIW